MTIRKSPYDTFVMKGVLNKNLIDKLTLLRINDYLTPLTKEIVELGKDLEISKDINLRAIRLIVGNNNESAIPAFDQPISLYTNTGELACVVIDVRPFIKRLNSVGEWAVRVSYEFNFAILRGVLCYLWESNEARHLQSISRLPIKIYARWIADNISRRFGLNPETQLKISIAAAIFYTQLFTEEAIGTVEKVRTIGIITAATDAPASLVEDIMAQMEEPITDLTEFAEKIVQVADTPRLEDFDQSILLTAVTGVWFGPSGRQMCGIALEHPPTWIAMLLCAATLRGYSQSGLSKLFYRTEAKDIQQLIASVFGLLRE